MTAVYVFLYVFIGCVLLATVCYIPKLAQIFGFWHKPEQKEVTKQRRIAVVIPARNESKTIPRLLESIAKQTYPKEYFSVNVIVKDAADPTVKLARAAGANVFVVPGQKCKGDALDGYFKSISEEVLDSNEAYVIVDADAVLSEDYVEQLNRALEHGKDIYVTRKRIKNYLYGKNCRSLACNLSALTYAIIDDMANSFRTYKGQPLQVCGQGLMVRTSVIKGMGGWKYRSLTEDYELKVDGFLRGLTFMYYPYAILYTEEAVTFREVDKRRVRWLTGFNQCSHIYGKRLRVKARQSGDIYLEFDYIYFAVSIAIYLVAAIVSVIAGIVFCVSMGAQWYKPFLLLIVIPVALTYLLLLVYTLIGMFCLRDCYKSITFLERAAVAVCGPMFLLQFIPIFVKSMLLAFKDEEDWEQVKRIPTDGEAYGEKA